MPQPLSIAVVGVSALLPGSTDVAGFWTDLLAGRDLISDVPPTHWRLEDYYNPDPTALDKTYAKRGGFLPEVPFDPVEFGIPPSTLPATDTSQLLALIVAQKVLEDATGGQFNKLDRDKVSVILGVTSAQGLLASVVKRLDEGVWRRSLRDAGIEAEQADAVVARIKQHYVPWQEATFPGLLGNVVAGRIANRFDLRGTNCVTDAACASSLAAIAMGISELVRGQSDLVITGGVDCLNDPFMYLCFSKTPALSPSGDCRPFDEKADGTMLGEGLAMFALKRLADAERDGDRVYAVLKGLGTASDGRSKSVYAPLPEGQARALERAYAEAGYGPEAVDLVEAHGTGTKAGDAAEFEGLRQVFGRAGAETQSIALGSVKSQIGHTKAAAGAAGLLKALLALHHKVLPPTIKIDKPNPALKLEVSPFYLNTRARPWVSGEGRPRRASVSSFGFGGSNFHLTAEEYRGPAARPARLRGHREELVLLSAASPGALAEAALALADEAKRGVPLPWLAHRALAGPGAGPARLAVVAGSSGQLAERLERAAKALRSAPEHADPSGAWASAGAQPGQVAFLFPGQGSQYVGMGAELAMTFEAARRVWDEAHPAGLHRRAFPPPAFDEATAQRQLAELTATDQAQPAIGLASLALLRVLQQLGLSPALTGGHSFGELTALHAAGVLSAPDFLAAARKRGERMAAAASGTPGAMTAVSARRERVEALLSAWGLPVGVANHNHPEQVVLSGPTEAIAAAEQRLQAEKLAFRRLQVATAFHSPVVAPASSEFGAFLSTLELRPGKVEAFSNSEAAPYPADAARARQLLAEQLSRPVRFVEQIEAMYAKGARTFVEVGPGSVLTELVGRILAGKPHRAVALDRKGKSGLTSLLEGLGQLWVAGVTFEAARLWEGYAPPLDPAKQPKPKLSVGLTGTNYGKPYPPPPGKDLPPMTYKPPAPVVAAPVAPAPAPAQAPAPVAALPTGDAGLAWVAAFQEAQRQTVEAHTAFQKTMADTHAAFIRSMETSFSTMSAMVTGAPMPVAAPMPMPALPAAPEPVRASNGVAHAPAPAPKAPPAPAPKPEPVAAKPAPTTDLTPLILEIVAATTGYPTEMLGMQMDLEADLGIDSIKRVEILSAVRERAPHLPEIQPNQLASLRTLAQIAEFLGKQGGNAPNVVRTSAAPATAPKAAAAPGVDLSALLLEVVASATGYPTEMLGMQMDLEADLGIDSIKRVEILSALRDRAPGLPEVQPAQLGTLRTLGQIVEFLRGGPQPAPTKAPEPKAAPKVEAPKAEVQRLVVEAVDAPLPGLVTPGLEGEVLVTDDGAGVAPALVARLQRQGLRARVVTEVPAGAEAVIFLGGLRPVADAAQAIAINRQAFAAAKALAPRAPTGGALLLVQDTGGDFGLSGRAGPRAWLAGLAGLARTAALEWPEVVVRAIDLERGERNPEQLAEALERELLQGGATREIGLTADGRRLALRDTPRKVEAGKLPLSERSVVVATGGARGVTAASLVALAKRTRARFALLGRTPQEPEPESLRAIADEAGLKSALLQQAQREGRATSPAELGAQVARVLAAREVEGTLAAIRAAGGTALYLAADVADPASLARALARVRQELGPITALVHGAGVLADKLIADKQPEQFDRVFDTKVEGLRALLEATREEPLELLALFSSVAARTGNPGQSDYAMANEVLHAVAASERRRRGPQARVVSIGWGPWEGGMVTPALAGHFAKRGVALLPVREGAEAFVDELAAPPADAQVIIGAPLGQAGRPVRARVSVSPSAQPYLEGHRIEGAVVVPVVQAIEWFARAARAARPELHLATLREVEVRRGIRLGAFAEPGERFSVRGREEATASGAGLSLELVGQGGQVHYLASAELGATPPALRGPGAAPALAPWAGGPIYDGRVLFHRPPFQAIREVEGLSEEGLVASLSGLRALGWPEEPWATDPAALDGALQLALLWGAKVLGGPSLPTRVGEVLLSGAPPSAGPLRCVLRRTSVQRERASCDLWLEAGGQVVAELRGVQLHARPEAARTAPALSGEAR